jgi:hypothetical protein
MYLNFSPRLRCDLQHQCCQNCAHGGISRVQAHAKDPVRPPMAKMRFALAETKQPFSLYFKHKLFDKNMARYLRRSARDPGSWVHSPAAQL